MKKSELRTRWTSRCYTDSTLNRVFNSMARGEEYLGIPKSQVREVLTWLRFFGLLDQQHHLTELGRIIHKYDPYFEEDTTRLLFQFNLVQQPTIIGEVFRREVIEVTKNDTVNFIHDKYSNSNFDSLERDFGILINTYIKKPVLPEDGRSLLGEFGLIKKKGNRYWKNPVKTGYFDPWFTLGLLYPFQGETKLSDIYEWLRCPFNLTTIDVMDLLYKAHDVKVVTTAGMNVVYLPEYIDLNECMEEHYKEMEKRFDKVPV